METIKYGEKNIGINKSNLISVLANPIIFEAIILKVLNRKNIEESVPLHFMAWEKESFLNDIFEILLYHFNNKTKKFTDFISYLKEAYKNDDLWLSLVFKLEKILATWFMIIDDTSEEIQNITNRASLNIDKIILSN